MSFPRLPFPGFRRPARPGDDDRALLARFVATGDEAAFALLVDRHGPLVRGTCRRVLGDAHLADDAFQATFFLLARKAPSLRLRAGLANWLYVVARRSAVRLAKRQSREGGGRPGVIDTAQAPDHRPDDLAELLEALDEELARLPDRYRGPLVACFLRARTQDEAAAEFGWSVSTLRRRLARGRELLRARLTARGATLGAGLLAGVACPATAAVPVDLTRATAGLAVAAWAGDPVDPHILALASEGSRMGTKISIVAGLLTLAGVAAALAGDGRPTPPKPEDRTVVVGSAPAGPARWVTIKGRVVFPAGRQVPEAKTVEVAKDKEHCLAKGPLADDALVIDPKTRGIKHVWVYLRPDDPGPGAAFPPGSIHPALLNPPAAEHVVDQPCCQFVPRVFAARAGDAVVFKNSAPIPHNVHLTANENEEFNVMTPPGLGKRVAGLKAERSPVRVKCDIHPWMACSFLVFDHPYFAVTGPDGRFEIRLAPAGKWRIAYRHELGFHKGKDGNKGFPVEVADAGRGTMELAPVEFEFPK